MFTHSRPSRPWLSSLGLILALAWVGCGDTQKKAATPTKTQASPTATSETTVTSAPSTTPTKPVSSTISVSEDVARACSLHFNDLATAPKFDFDKFDLLPDDHEVLAKIGHCVMTGPLKGRSIRLVGHADPRGTEQYNMALGARRAHAVAAFLTQFGVDGQRIKETSRGELDAIGNDEMTWQLDRRVDVVLNGD